MGQVQNKLAERGVKNTAGGSVGVRQTLTCFVLEPPRQNKEVHSPPRHQEPGPARVMGHHKEFNMGVFFVFYFISKQTAENRGWELKSKNNGLCDPIKVVHLLSPLGGPLYWCIPPMLLVLDGRECYC